MEVQVKYEKVLGRFHDFEDERKLDGRYLRHFVDCRYFMKFEYGLVAFESGFEELGMEFLE